MATKSVSTVVFRFDGVLLNVNLVETSRNMAKHMHVPVTKMDTFICALAGVVAEFPIIMGSQKVSTVALVESLDAMMKPILVANDLTGAQVVEALKKSELYSCKVAEDALDTIMYLYQKGYNLVSTGNVFETVQSELLREYGMLKYFTSVFGPIGSYYRSHPASMNPILKGNSPEAYAYVSNSLGADLRVGRNAGMKTIWLNQICKVTVPKSLTFTPDHVIRQLHDLVHIF